MKWAYLLLISSAALADPAQPDDYPGSPTDHGSVVVQLYVSPQGTVTNCELVRPSGVASLDSAACPTFVKRARFTPARNSNGNPKADTAKMTIHYIVPHVAQTRADLAIGAHDATILYNPASEQLDAAGHPQHRGIGRSVERLPARWAGDYPESARMRGEQGEVAIVIDVDVRGKPSGCSVVRTSGYADLNETTCAYALKLFRYRPALDFSGKPMPGEDLYTANWRLQN